MKIIVEKVFQSPSTPVMEVAYLIQFFDVDKPSDKPEYQKLIKFLETEIMESLNL